MFTGDELNLRPLFLYTALPQLWELFDIACSISIFDVDGLPSLSALDSIINFNDIEIYGLTYMEFWQTMQYFLNRLRQKIIAERKRNGIGTSPKDKG